MSKRKWTDDNLAQVIETNRINMRNRQCHPIGKMLSIMLAQDDSAQYAEKESVRNRIKLLSQHRGLQLEWPQSSAPHISWNGKQDGLVFPFGCKKPPSIRDPRVPGGIVNQNILDYASGYVVGKDGSQLIVLQPVMYIGVWIMDGLYTFISHKDPISGKYPALLMNATSDEAHIVYGALELTNASAPPSTEMPWQHAAPVGETAGLR